MLEETWKSKIKTFLTLFLPNLDKNGEVTGAVCSHPDAQACEVG